MLNRLILFLLILTALSFCRTYANDAKNNEDNVNNNRRNKEILPASWGAYNGLKLNLSDDGTSYLKAGFFGQYWLRHSRLNPGSVDTDGALIDNSTDMAFRRMRMSFSARLFDKVQFYTQLGANNQTFKDGDKPQIFFHDFWMSYSVDPDKLNIGAGLSMWNGVSRLTNASSISKMMLDYPGFIFPGLGRTDQAGRQMGVFAYGNIKGVNYRFTISDPFEYSGEQLAEDIAYETPNGSISYKGYVAYNFLDQEIPSASFMPMTYLGKKKILNVGFGFDVYPGSMTYFSSEKNEEITVPQKHFGIDVLAELPQSNGSVISVYSVGYHNDYGPNYLRACGTMNTYGGGSLNGEPIPQGGGINEWTMGTGKIWYTNVGYILPKRYRGEQTVVQPVFASTYKNFEGLSEPSWQYDIGLNYYLYDHNFKITGQYSNRPIYQGSTGPESTAVVVDHKGLFILQLQVVI